MRSLWKLHNSILSISVSPFTRIFTLTRNPISTSNSGRRLLCRKLFALSYSPHRKMSTETNKDTLEKPAQLAVEIFQKAVESVKPSNLLKTKFKVEKSVLTIVDGKGTQVDLKEFKRIFVIGFGKAVLPMAEEVQKILGDRITRCIVNIPVGFRDSSIKEIEINRGAKDNIPDEAAYLGSKKIVQLVQDCDPSDLLIVLITGGGSALLSYPLHPITVKELASLVKTLSRGGATIQELNSVRKRLSLVKGGGILSLARSSRIISLILSDVLGDPIDIIASGPTVPNPDAESLAKEIIEKYMSLNSLPKSIKDTLNSPTLDPKSKDVTNAVIGNNTIALEAGVLAAKQLNLHPIIVTKLLSGEASQVGEDLGHATQAISYLFRNKKTDASVQPYISVISKICSKLGLNEDKINEIIDKLLDESIQKECDGFCLLFGGETTVKVVGKGVGGRNQELALSAGIKIDSCANNQHVKGKVALLSAGTDGFDGPCDAAGAVIDSSTLQKGYVDKLSPSLHRSDNNSYNYFKSNSQGAYHIITGHTETNVMDLVLIVVIK